MVMASRGSRTTMEVWDFAPPAEGGGGGGGSGGSASGDRDQSFESDSMDLDVGEVGADGEAGGDDIVEDDSGVGAVELDPSEKPYVKMKSEK